MPGSGSLIKAFTLAGYSWANSVVGSSTFDSEHSWAIPLPVGNVVTAWVKTDADTAACNLATGHGKTSGTYDVFWTIAGVNYVRYGVTNTITGDACALDGGSGDAFPATATTGVIITKQVVHVVNIDGDNVVMFGAVLQSSDSTVVGHVDLQDSGNATVGTGHLKLTESQTHVDGLQHTYQQTAARALLTGNPITQAKASNGSATTAATLVITAGIDSSP